MKIQPLADKVLVLRLEAEKVTSGGIQLPTSAKQKPNRGKVIGVGSGKPLEDGTVREMSVKKGDLILFISHAGTQIKVDNVEYLMMSETDILAVIEE